MTLKVDGVSLTTRPEMTFLCPEVTADGIEATAMPAEVPADGATASTVTVRAVDACGNPAFDRPARLVPVGSPVADVVPAAETRTLSKPGDAADGTATFSVTSQEAGGADFDVVVDGASVRLEDLVVFTLGDVVQVDVEPLAPLVVTGQAAPFRVRVENIGDRAVEVSVVAEAEGLNLLDLDGGPLPRGIGVLEPGDAFEGRLETLVAPAPGAPGLKVGATLAAPGGDPAGTVWAPWVRLETAGEGAGCSCRVGGRLGRGLWGFLLVAAGLLFRRRRRR